MRHRRLHFTTPKEGVQILLANTVLVSSAVADIDCPQLRTSNPAHNFFDSDPQPLGDLSGRKKRLIHAEI